jgi:beta-glucosidase
VILELAAEELQVFSSQNKYELEKGYFEIEVGNPVNYLKAILEIG